MLAFASRAAIFYSRIFSVYKTPYAYMLLPYYQLHFLLSVTPYLHVEEKTSNEVVVISNIKLYMHSYSYWFHMQLSFECARITPY